MSLVRVENVSKEYRLGKQVVAALHDVTLNVEEGVFMAIAGPSGSGLADRLGWPVGAMLDIMSSEEIGEWKAFYELRNIRQEQARKRREMEDGARIAKRMPKSFRRK